LNGKKDNLEELKHCNGGMKLSLSSWGGGTGGPSWLWGWSLVAGGGCSWTTGGPRVPTAPPRGPGDLLPFA